MDKYKRYTAKRNNKQCVEMNEYEETQQNSFCKYNGN